MSRPVLNTVNCETRLREDNNNLQSISNPFLADNIGSYRTQPFLLPLIHFATKQPPLKMGHFKLRTCLSRLEHPGELEKSI